MTIAIQIFGAKIQFLISIASRQAIKHADYADSRRLTQTHADSRRLTQTSQ